MNEPDFKFAKFASFLHPQRRDAVESLIQMRAEFADDLRLLQEQLATREKEIEAFDFLIDSITRSIEATQKAGAKPPGEAIESPNAALPDAEETSGASDPMSGAATVQGIAHCRTQREASYVIAKMNGGAIDLNTAAVVIKAAELSKGMISTVVSSLHNFMTHSDDWSYAGPSRFELVTDRESVSEALSMTDSGDEESSEANAVEGDSMMAQTVDATAA